MSSASITCPRCGRTSYHPQDVANRYCGSCHWWTSDPGLGSMIPPPEPHEIEKIAAAADESWERAQRRSMMVIAVAVGLGLWFLQTIVLILVRS